MNHEQKIYESIQLASILIETSDLMLIINDNNNNLLDKKETELI